MGVCFVNNNKRNLSGVSSSNWIRESEHKGFSEEDTIQSEIENFQFYKKIDKERNISTIADFTGKKGTVVKLIQFNKQSLNQGKAQTVCVKSNCSSATTNYTVSNYTKADRTYHRLTKLISTIYEQRRDLFDKILEKNPPSNLRWISWMTVARANSETTLETEEKCYLEFQARNLSEKQNDQILKDLSRTAPRNPYFQSEEGKTSLYNVLKAIALCDSSVGYCQGMNIVVANLLLVSDGNEVETFFVLKYIFFNPKGLQLKEFYSRGFPKLHEYIYTVKELTKIRFPKAYNKIEEFGLPDEAWIFKWLQSMFSLTIDFSVGVRLWDCLFIHGLDFLVKYCLAYIKVFGYKINASQDMCEFVNIMRISDSENLALRIKLREILVKEALNIKLDVQIISQITHSYLNCVKNEYFDENSFYNEMEQEVVESSGQKQFASVNQIKLMTFGSNVSGIEAALGVQEIISEIESNRDNDSDYSINQECSLTNISELQELVNSCRISNEFVTKYTVDVPNIPQPYQSEIKF